MKTEALLGQICEAVREAGELIRSSHSVEEVKGKKRGAANVLLQNMIPWFKNF